MKSVLTYLLKTLLLPILQEGVNKLFGWVRDFFETRKIKKDQTKKTEAVKNATTSEESRDAHRGNGRI